VVERRKVRAEKKAKFARENGLRSPAALSIRPILSPYVRGNLSHKRTC
jgi:hypothetical protein